MPRDLMRSVRRGCVATAIWGACYGDRRGVDGMVMAPDHQPCTAFQIWPKDHWLPFGSVDRRGRRLPEGSQELPRTETGGPPGGLQPFASSPHLHVVTMVSSQDGGVSNVAFEDFSQWAPMVRLAWLLSGSRHDGEDVVHDAFLRVEQRFGDVEQPVAYLRSAVVNGVRMLQRHREVERRHLPKLEPPDDAPETGDLLEALRTLPAKERHALVLRYYLGLSVQEVATQLTCPLGTAKSLIHRGIEHVRGRLSS